jgi:hypothetical protein
LGQVSSADAGMLERAVAATNARADKHRRIKLHLDRSASAS